MKARLIKRQDNQPETARQQASTASKPKKSTARLVAQTVNEWKQRRQASQPSDARAKFAALFAPSPMSCE
ncbi:MAG: hypothetical protein ABI977_03125 [Acidobacteriota bacterium]